VRFGLQFGIIPVIIPSVKNTKSRLTKREILRKSYPSTISRFFVCPKRRIYEPEKQTGGNAHPPPAVHYGSAAELIRTMGIDKAWFAFWASEVVACVYSLWAVRKELR